MSRIGKLVILMLLLGLPTMMRAERKGTTPANADVVPCFTPLSLTNIRLKDHTLFQAGAYFYVASISLPESADGKDGESTFAYARTRDFCAWEDLGPLLGLGADGSADEAFIWAPHVVVENGIYYMFYTGVNRNIAQTIMLATTTTPEDPQSWKKQGVVFRPDHPWMVYPGPDSWSDARDPMVFHYEDHYYMYYTGQDVSGYIVGIAMADSLAGPWLDMGATLRTPRGTIPESPYLVSFDGHYYLFYNGSGWKRIGQVWQSSPSPFGPWEPPIAVPRGWAYDFDFTGTDWYASYVIGNGEAIGFQPLHWETNVTPPAPNLMWRTYVPSVLLPGE